LITERKLPIRLIGVGGVSTADHVQESLAAGATAVQLATSAMTNPAIAIQLRKDLATAYG